MDELNPTLLEADTINHQSSEKLDDTVTESVKKPVLFPKRPLSHIDTMESHVGNNATGSLPIGAHCKIVASELEELMKKYPVYFRNNPGKAKKLASQFIESQQLIYNCSLEVNHAGDTFAILSYESGALFDEDTFFDLDIEDQTRYLEEELRALSMQEFRTMCHENRSYFTDDEMSIAPFRAKTFDQRMQYLVLLFKKKKRRREKVAEINNRLNLLLKKNDLWEARSYLRNLRKHDDDIPPYLYKDQFTKALVKVETDILFITRRKEEAEKMIKDGDLDNAQEFIEKHLANLAPNQLDIHSMFEKIEQQKKECTKKKKLSRFEKMYHQALEYLEAGKLEEADILCAKLERKMPMLEKKHEKIASGVHILTNEIESKYREIDNKKSEERIQLEINRVKQFQAVDNPKED